MGSEMCIRDSFKPDGVFRIGDDGIFGAERPALRRQFLNLLMPRQREYAEFFGVAGDNVQRAFAYAAGTA